MTPHILIGNVLLTCAQVPKRLPSKRLVALTTKFWKGDVPHLTPNTKALEKVSASHGDVWVLSIGKLASAVSLPISLSA